MTDLADDAGIEDLDDDRWRAVIDRAAKLYLDMDIDEFLRRLAADDFEDVEDKADVMRVAVLVPPSLRAG
jgi:hypothetical protein